MEKGLQYIGEGIGFAGLCVAVAWCEINGHSHPVFWVMIFLWIMFFGPKDNNKKESHERE
jgi:hypothetical protein